MKIYSVEDVLSDRFDVDCNLVCSTVDINVALAYMRDNPIGCYHNYCVTVFDGFSGKAIQRAVVSHLEAVHIKSLDFEDVK